MFAGAGRWLKRNRNRIAFGAAVVGGTYYVGQYVLNKITEARQRSQLDKIAKDNIKRRFEQNQTDCTLTVLALLPTLNENILARLPCEDLTNELTARRAERLARTSGEGASESSSLRDGDTISMSSLQTGSFVHTSRVLESDPNAPPRTKAQLWGELKTTSITRAFTMIYSLSLLILFTRIQLNLLGRMDYVRSVMALAQPITSPSNSIVLEDHDGETGATIGDNYDDTRRYLIFSYQLLHRGYAQIMEKVRNAVEEVFGPVRPQESLSADRLRELVLEVRKRVEGATEQDRYLTRWLPYLLPPREEEEALLVESNIITPPQTSSSSSFGESSTADSPPKERKSYVDTSSGPLRDLLDETADLIDSPSFTKIHTLILNSMFSLLFDQKVIQALYPQPSYNPLQLPKPAPHIPGYKSSTPPSQSCLPSHESRQSNNGATNEYLAKADADVRELDAFAAVIYTSNLPNTTTEARPKSSEGQIKSSDGIGVSDVGAEKADEMIESQLESAWAKVAGSTSFSEG
ncbi:Peroxisomal biogenesis factor 3 [Cyphellophora attinorum]|uniref:Peroxisomal biogenesis factor 3 n=1 Tax=Cyphellophora attinorum TaxID=1664694 RepID=A0A0N1HQI4_9EURO|nr:Peroxisomal biogenesis factor 3 [Phialophora attinorum]KPI37774.1 Peroxisomal biogenesis factor 3 [Phialophora attinorum]